MSCALRWHYSEELRILPADSQEYKRILTKYLHHFYICPTCHTWLLDLISRSNRLPELEDLLEEFKSNELQPQPHQNL
jgi:hypothetical protein